MIRLFFILSLLSGGLLYRYPAVSYAAPVNLEVGCSNFESENQFQTLLQESGKKPVFWSRGHKSELSPDSMYFVPPMGQGYFEYQKLGKEIAYYSKPEELFWRRQSASYPVTDVEGRWIFLLAGDLTSVRLMDRNGNSASIAPLQGILLTDYSFITLVKDKIIQHWASIIFSTGPLYLVRFEPNFQVFKLSLPKVGHFFAKSVAMSGDKVAVHFQQMDVDYIRIYRFNQDDVSLNQVESVRLPYTVPHRISMSFTGNGLIVSAGELVAQLVDDQLTLLQNHQEEKISPLPQLSVEFTGDTLATESISMAGGTDFGFIFDSSFLPIAKVFRPKTESVHLAYRLLPDSNGLAIEDKNGYCRIRPSLSR